MEENGVVLSKLLSSYNIYFNKYFDSIADFEFDNNCTDEDKTYDILSKEKIWFETYDENLKAIPKELYDTLTNPANEQEMHSIFKDCVGNTSFEIPEFIKEYLVNNKSFMINVLKNILNSDIVKEDFYYSNDKYTNEDFDIYIEATKISSIFKELVPVLFDALSRCNNCNDVVYDNISYSLRHMDAINDIIAYINEEEEVSDKHLSLFDLLSELGIKNDDIYNCMKNAFKKTANHEVKKVLAFCFLNYGDSRIVPVLRKYAKEIESLAETDKAFKDNLYVLCSVIDDLGGNTKDIQKF